LAVRLDHYIFPGTAIALAFTDYPYTLIKLLDELYAVAE
jgi:hypothetical protein